MKMTATQYQATASEDAIHKAILQHLRQKFPRAVIHHSANERKGVMSGKKAKALGQLAGFPDILVLHEGRAWFFEVKKEGGQLSPEQKAVGEAIAFNQFRWACVRSVEDVDAYLDEWAKDVPHLPTVGYVS